jgi:hypothetical protein
VPNILRKITIIIPFTQCGRNDWIFWRYVDIETKVLMSEIVHFLEYPNSLYHSEPCKWHTRERLAAQVLAVIAADWSNPTDAQILDILESARWAVEARLSAVIPSSTEQQLLHPQSLSS